MKKYSLLFFVLIVFSCSKNDPTAFSSEALNDVFISMDAKEFQFKEILVKNRGKKIVIDVWASWCKDCLESLPEIKKLQSNNSDFVFLFLSLDKDLESWKNGVERLQIKGQHYFIKSGWEGDFGNFLNLNWIPRYLVINEEGKILIFNETRVSKSLVLKK